MTAQATYYIIRALVALVAIPFHEAGHALAAWLLGDATAKREGRLSLNPFAHFDLLGTLCMVFSGFQRQTTFKMIEIMQYSSLSIDQFIIEFLILLLAHRNIQILSFTFSVSRSFKHP